MGLSQELYVSPFSMQCNYQIYTFPYTPRPPGWLTPYEREVYNLVKAAGAAAFFQVVKKSKHKKKLKSLSRCGVLALHRLEGTYKLNILTPGPITSLQETLKSLAFAGLLVKLKEMGQVFVDEDSPYRVVILNGKVYHVVVHRENELVHSAVLLASKPERCILLAEAWHPEFETLTNARILIDCEPYFRKPDGKPE